MHLRDGSRRNIVLPQRFNCVFIPQKGPYSRFHPLFFAAVRNKPGLATSCGNVNPGSAGLRTGRGWLASAEPSVPSKKQGPQETGARPDFFRPDFFEGLLRPHCLCGRVRLAGTASPHLRGGRTGCTRWGRIGLHPLKMAPFGPDSIFCARSRRSARPSELGITIHIHEHMHGRGSRRAGSAGLRTRRG